MNMNKLIALAVTSCVAAAISPLQAAPQLPIIGWGAFSPNNASAKRLLAEAEKAGLKLVIGVNAHGVKNMTAGAEAFTAAVKDSPALAEGTIS